MWARSELFVLLAIFLAWSGPSASEPLWLGDEPGHCADDIIRGRIFELHICEAAPFIAQVNETVEFRIAGCFPWNRTASASFTIDVAVEKPNAMASPVPAKVSAELQVLLQVDGVAPVWRSTLNASDCDSRLAYCREVVPVTVYLESHVPESFQALYLRLEGGVGCIASICTNVHYKDSLTRLCVNDSASTSAPPMLDQEQTRAVEPAEDLAFTQLDMRSMAVSKSQDVYLGPLHTEPMDMRHLHRQQDVPALWSDSREQGAVPPADSTHMAGTLQNSKTSHAAKARVLQGVVDPNRPLYAPNDCSGWPEPRVYLEGQNWFTPPTLDVTSQSSHIHLGTCFPWNQTVSGVLTLDLLIQKHNYPYDVPLSLTATWVYGAAVPSLGTLTMPGNCTDNDSCKTVLRVYLDTSYALNGPNSLKLMATFRVHGTATTASMEVNLRMGFKDVANAVPLWAPSGPLIPAFPGNLGTLALSPNPWHYTFSDLFGMQLSSPSQPMSGQWIITYRAQEGGPPSLGGGQVPITRMVVTLDPAFHAVPVNPGQVLVDVYTAAVPSLCTADASTCEGSVIIDTLQLTDGWHRLVLRGDSFVAANDPKFLAAPATTLGAGTASSVFLTAFYVNNSLTPQNAALPSSQQMLSQPPNCVGWPEDRLYQEAQQWFTAAGSVVGASSSFVKLGTCFPWDATVSGILTLDLLLQKGNYPDNLGFIIYAQWAYPELGTSTFTTANVTLISLDPRNICNGGPLCQRVVRASLDTRGALNGWQWVQMGVRYSPVIGQQPWSVQLLGRVYVNNLNPWSSTLSPVTTQSRNRPSAVTVAPGFTGVRPAIIAATRTVDFTAPQAPAIDILASYDPGSSLPTQLVMTLDPLSPGISLLYDHVPAYTPGILSVTVPVLASSLDDGWHSVVVRGDAQSAAGIPGTVSSAFLHSFWASSSSVPMAWP